MGKFQSNEDFYEKGYSELLDQGIIGWFKGITHKTLEFGISDSYNLLEVGAGRGQHINYVKKYSTYTMTDLRPQFLPKIKKDSVKIETSSVDCSKLNYDDNSFDRLIATCLIIHLLDPVTFLRECKRVVRPGGMISLYVACEPSILLRFAQKFVTRRKENDVNGYFRHYSDHVSHYPRTICFIKHEFSRIRLIRYPFPILSWNFNLWAIAQIKNLK